MEEDELAEVIEEYLEENDPEGFADILKIVIKKFEEGSGEEDADAEILRNLKRALRVFNDNYLGAE
jgi:hypothetical protein